MISHSLEIMMALGEFRFSIATAAYDELFSSQDWQWVEQEQIGSYPALQYIGPTVETKQLKGTIYPTFRGGLTQLERLKKQATEGSPLLLVSGRGRVFGQWCIARIEHTESFFFADGAAQKVEFNIELKRFKHGLPN